MAAQELLDGEAEALTRKAIELALSGDPVALRLCLERILPRREERLVEVALPKIKKAADVASAVGTLVQAVGCGILTPGEAETMTRLLETHGKLVEQTKWPTFEI